MNRGLIASFVLLAGLSPRTAQADVPSGAAEAAQAPEPDGLTPEEREALMRALGADGASAPSEGTPDLSPPTAQPTGVAAVLQSLNPNLSLILDVAAAYFSDAPLQVGGHDPNRTGFTFQQLEMHLDSNVDPYLRLDANLVFSPFGVEVEEAYATTLDLPAHLQVRAGQFLTRFGRANATHPHSWHFVDQPLVLGKFFGGEGSRGLGVELSWLTPLPWYAELVASANDAAGASTARSFYGADDLGISSWGDVLYTTALKQFFSLDDDWSVLWGLSGQFGPNPTGNGNRTVIAGTDVHVRFRPLDHAGRTSLELTAEAVLRRRQVPDDVLQDWGLYAQLVWQIDAEWELAARYEHTSGVDGDPLDPDEDGPRHRTAVSATFYPTHFSRLRLQGALDQPSWRDDPIWALTVSLEALVGAHGAHSY